MRRLKQLGIALLILALLVIAASALSGDLRHLPNQCLATVRMVWQYVRDLFAMT